MMDIDVLTSFQMRVCLGKREKEKKQANKSVGTTAELFLVHHCCS
jgi:hypothetical protein